MSRPARRLREAVHPPLHRPSTPRGGGRTRRVELVLPITLAVAKGLTVSDLADTFAIYPSLSGSITEAGRRLMGVDDLS